MVEETKKEEEVKPVKYNIACGMRKDLLGEGYIGVDISPLPGVDIVHDLEKYPWPISANSADEIVCSHYVEHTSDLIKFMDEIYRILKVGGKCTIIAPYYTSMRAWQDPTHKRAISEASFLYFNKDWRAANKLEHYGIKCDFDYTYGYAISNEWASRSEESRNFAIAHYWNIVNDIQVVLVKRGVKKEG